MKTHLLLLLIIGFLISSLQGFAQNDKYTQAMMANLKTMQTAETPLDWQNVANKFEQIAKVKSDEWLPNYWSAYSTLIINFMSEDLDRKDEYIDKAEIFLNKADELEKENAEILVMKAYIAMARLAIDGQSRWQTQMPIFEQSLAKATQLDGRNPRIDYIRGTNLFYTPEQFGGGKAVACPLLHSSLAKFQEFQPTSELYPNWGKPEAEKLAQSCEQ